MSNPLAAPMVERINTHQNAYGLGIMDENNMEQIMTLRKNCENTLGTDWSKASDVCSAPLNYISDIGGNVFTFDARMFSSDWVQIRNPFVKYLTTSKKVKELYESIHID